MAGVEVMTAQIVTHDEREPWGWTLDLGIWDRNGDSVARYGFAKEIPGQLWERLAERES